MSVTIASAVATCTIPDGTPTVEDVAYDLCKFIGDNDNVFLPDDLEDLDSDEFVEAIIPYLSMKKDTELTIVYDSESDTNNNDSSTFDFLASHYKALQTSELMTVQWCVYDTKHGYSAGTDYYRKDGTKVNLIADSEALDKIADLLSDDSWSVDTLMSISDVIESTGRKK